MIEIGELSKLGAQALASGQVEAALRIYWRLVDVAPMDISFRLGLADALALANAWEAAAPVYAATATLAMRSGHPLVSILTGKILAEHGVDVGPLYDELASLYAAESERVARYGERFAPVDPSQKVKPPDMQADIAPAALKAGASQAGADLSRVENWPKMLHRIPLLSDLSSSTFRRVLDTMIAHRLPADAMVIREGEMGESFFLVATGQVRVYRLSMQGRETELARLHAGSIFGEMALIHASPRTASVQVVGSADLLEFTREGLASLAAEMTPVAVALDRFCRDRLLANLLATAPIFRPFSRKQRMDLLKRFTGHEVAPDTEVIREGDEGRGLYVLLSGEMDVTKRGDGSQPVLLATLKAGDVFGEISLLRGGPATATVRAARQSTVLFLDKVYFQRLIGAIPEIRNYFESLSEERLADTQVVLQDDLLIEGAEEDELVLI